MTFTKSWNTKVHHIHRNQNCPFFVFLFLRTFKSIFFPSIWPHQLGFVHLWHQNASKACLRIKKEVKRCSAEYSWINSIGPLPTSISEVVVLTSHFLNIFKAPPVLIASVLISSHVFQPFSKGQLKFKAFCLGFLSSHTLLFGDAFWRRTAKEDQVMRSVIMPLTSTYDRTI